MADHPQMAIRRGRAWLWTGAAVAALALVVLVGAGPAASRVEQAAYAVEQSDGPIEVRAYPALLAAQTIVSGSREAAISDGFRRVAGYIFGGNQGAEKIAMTAPVIQTGAPGGWSVRFVLPRRWTRDTLPTPNDPRVTVTSLPPRRYAAIRFSGLAGDRSIAEHAAILRRWTAAHGLRVEGAPVLAFYDPPWTLPFLRRNEVLLALAP